MTPEAFITTWHNNTRNEAAASKSHFLDLCALLDVPPPHSDPTGTTYAFEKGVRKAAGGGGWADVWKRGCFGWEYKSRGGDLEAAHDQLLRYAGALENPPLLITSDMTRIVVRTNWTNAVSERREFVLEDLRDPTVRALLKACWTDPERWRPTVTRQSLTEKAAAEFAELARRLRDRGHESLAVAHFVNRLVFCLFADDVGLLPDRLLSEMLALGRRRPAEFAGAASELFRAMRDRGGRIGFQAVQWFNGGSFDDESALPLQAMDMDLLTRAATLDWAEIDPSIFGTLFERGLDPDKRSQLGAHYTDRDKIWLLVEAVIVRPLLAEWSAAHRKIVAAMDERARLNQDAATNGDDARTIAEATGINAASRAARAAMRRAAEQRTRRRAELMVEASGIYSGFLDRIRAYRVLDPACGSGNFLYVSLLALKDLERQVIVEAEMVGMDPALPLIGPETVLGIEINEYAAELARVSVWIGHIQWALRNGYPMPSEPVLRKLDTIECRDAVLAADGSVAEWPAVDAIVGNPPFLGDKAMIGTMGEDYTIRLRDAYSDRLPGGVDLVCYWFERAREALAAGNVERVGLVATNSIRGGANRRVLDRISHGSIIFAAWPDEPWTLDGAAVRVSLVCFARDPTLGIRLNGQDSEQIHPDLSTGTSDLTTATQLADNRGVVFNGIQKTGPFEIAGDTARIWMNLPTNPNGLPNSDVLKPYWNGIDLTRRSRDNWIVDFGSQMGERDAAYFAAPYAYVARAVKPIRSTNKLEALRRLWWRHWRPREGMMAALAQLSRAVITPEVSKHRIFAWLPPKIGADKNLIVIARDDDTTFGILHSR